LRKIVRGLSNAASKSASDRFNDRFDEMDGRGASPFGDGCRARLVTEPFGDEERTLAVAAGGMGERRPFELVEGIP
jgi:hypothetical protein